jgi:FAD/FMN-containing dehydrogenase
MHRFRQRATVTYPKSVNDVSEIVKIGAANGVNVVARSGGVSCLSMPNSVIV